MAGGRRFVIGVDIGGTFTDTVIVDESGHMVEAKVPSTPGDFSKGFIDSIAEGASQVGLTLSDMLNKTVLIKHGLTVASNAVATRSGARVGLVTTRGHEDTIFIMRAIGRVAGLPMDKVKFIARTDKPDPLVPKRRVRGVTERVDYKGSVVVPLDERDVEGALSYLVREEVDSIAISLLWSFMNPTHERRIRDLIRAREARTFVVASSDVCPVIGEYERTATVVLDAYVGPILARYLVPLQRRLLELGYTGALLVLLASGGVAFPETAIAHGVGTVDAGPTAGVVATSLLCDSLGISNAIATDVGGTTFKVGFVVDGAIPMAREAILGQYTVTSPMIDTVFIGTGGGSIAWVDPVTRTLHVGPQSAGADPGPACYGFGGAEPTVTDAELLLGYLNPERFLGGKMRLRKELAEGAISDRVGRPMGMGTVEAAVAIHEIAAASFADLLRSAFFARGYDPRDFVLFSYGGAGPFFGATLATELGIRQVIVPLMATVHSAFGAAACDVVHVHQRSEFMAIPVDPERVEEIFGELERTASEQIRREGIDAFSLSRSIEMRYHFQEHLVETPAPTGPYTDDTIRGICDAFESKYERLYGKGSAYREAGVDMVTFRVTSRGAVSKPMLRRLPLDGEDASHAFGGTRDVYWKERGGFRPTPTFVAERLRPGNMVTGPAIVEAFGHTLVIPAGTVGQANEYLNVVLAVGG
jgi:N-methylhydantoinase A